MKCSWCIENDATELYRESERYEGEWYCEDCLWNHKYNLGIYDPMKISKEKADEINRILTENGIPFTTEREDDHSQAVCVGEYSYYQAQLLIEDIFVNRWAGGDKKP